MYYKQIEMGMIMLALACLSTMQCLDSKPIPKAENATCSNDTILLKEGKMIYDSTKSKHWKLIPNH